MNCNCDHHETCAVCVPSLHGAKRATPHEHEPRAKKRGWRVSERGMKMFRDLGWGYTAATEGKA